MMRRLTVTCALLALGAGLWPAAARAQQTGTATPLAISTLQSGPVAAPDVRFGQVNDRDATLVGGYAGWLTGRQLLVGAAGYWLANGDDGFGMRYGGILTRWTFRGDRAVGVSAGVLLGFGSATLTRPYGDVFDDPLILAPAGGRGNSQVRFGGLTRPTDPTPVRVRDGFVVAEPHVNAVVTITPWLHLDAGLGYRLIGASDLLDEHLRGPSLSIGLRFGGT